MNEPNETLARALPLAAEKRSARFLSLPPKLLYSIFALVACFGIYLYDLVRFALQSDLYSYILLVPFISGYLFRLNLRSGLDPAEPNRVAASILILMGVAALVTSWTVTLSGVKLTQQDSLALSISSFVFLLCGLCALFLSRPAFRSSVFPQAFLLFMIPFPVALEHAIEAFLQIGSAPPAYWFFKLAGTPVFRQDLVFQLPGMSLQIAPECSGIRSTLVLFMTSLVAGHLFLRSRWKRTILAVAVIPLALLRNGFRVFVIGELCVRVGPHMIDSRLHHQGGPIFFALSLIPFSFLVFYLVKSDRRAPLIKPSAAVT
jgi:exosortase C (VPDSG-CTERM-specific)